MSQPCAWTASIKQERAGSPVTISLVILGLAFFLEGIRLGLVEEGETPFRIVDPALGTADGEDPVGEETLPTAPWYEQLWDSVSLPPEEEKPANPARDEATSPDRLPTVPEPAPEPAP